ncbi:MAG: hypothetical protein GY841_10365 [FCB group bacterium]|nr:hypothetical protein [FCB group bacterium]
MKIKSSVHQCLYDDGLDIQVSFKRLGIAFTVSMRGKLAAFVMLRIIAPLQMRRRLRGDASAPVVGFMD